MFLALNVGSALLADEHGPAVAAVFAAPLAIAMLLFGATFLARHGNSLAGAWLDYLGRTPVIVRLGLLFIALDAVLHAGLVVPHLDHDRFLALVFAADALALLLVAAWMTAADGWEPPAILLIVANLIAYVWFVDTGRESADAVGLGCQVLELVALALVIGHTIRWSQARRSGGELEPS